MSAWVGAGLKASPEQAVISDQGMPRENLFQNFSSQDCTSESRCRNGTNKGATSRDPDDEQEDCRGQEPPFADMGKHVVIPDDNFSTQRFAAKERLIVELMSPRRRYQDKIADDQ